MEPSTNSDYNDNANGDDTEAWRARTDDDNLLILRMAKDHDDNGTAAKKAALIIVIFADVNKFKSAIENLASKKKITRFVFFVCDFARRG